jgi:ribose transport system permease protein
VTAAVLGGARTAANPVVMLARRGSYAGFAAALLVVFLIVNVTIDPVAFGPSGLFTTIGLASPVVLAAVASTPVILSGGGGVDLSVGPLMSLIGALVVVGVIQDANTTSPAIILPVALGSGICSGLLNGSLVAIVRLQPIVATLGTYLCYIGTTLLIVPQPTGTVPAWLAAMSGGGSLALVAGVLLLWWLATRTPFYPKLMATGGDDRAAFAAGIPVTAVRLTAYTMTGFLAAVAGLSLTALLGSVDPNAGAQYTLLGIAAVALGGVSLAGGRGGMFGAVVGGVNIFLIENILTYYNKSAFVEQLAFGLVLVLAVVGNSLTSRWGEKPA